MIEGRNKFLTHTTTLMLRTTCTQAQRSGFLRVHYAKYNTQNKWPCLSVLLCHNRNSGKNLKDFGVGHHVTSFT